MMVERLIATAPTLMGRSRPGPTLLQVRKGGVPISALRQNSQTLVLYRTRPTPRRQVGSGRCAGRVRYSCLKEAARGEALMQIEWFWGDEKGLGNREWN